MKRFFQFFTVAVLLGTTLGFSTVSAKEKKEKTRQYNYYMQNSNSIAEQRTAMLGSKIELTEDQKAKVFELEVKLADAQENIKNIYKRDGNRDAMRSNTIEAIKAHDAEIEKILTPEQNAKLAGPSTEG